VTVCMYAGAPVCICWQAAMCSI